MKEYRSGDPWPAADNVEWEYKHRGDWKVTYNARNNWDEGHRVRFHIPEVKTKERLREESWSVVKYAQCLNDNQLHDISFDAGWEAKTKNPEVE